MNLAVKFSLEMNFYLSEQKQHISGGPAMGP